MKKLMMYSSLAALMIVAMGQVHGACGGGGYHAPFKIAPKPARDLTLNSTRFDSLSMFLDLTERQAKEISAAKSEINVENTKRTTAQTSAQTELNACTGDCAAAQIELTRSTDALNLYNTSTEFNLRLHTILRAGQAKIFFQS